MRVSHGISTSRSTNRFGFFQVALVTVLHGAHFVVLARELISEFGYRLGVGRELRLQFLDVPGLLAQFVLHAAGFGQRLRQLTAHLGRRLAGAALHLAL